MSDNRTQTQTSIEIHHATQDSDWLTVNTPSGDVKVNPAEVGTIHELKRALFKQTGHTRMNVFDIKSFSGEPLRDHELLANHQSAEWTVVFDDQPSLIVHNCKVYGSANIVEIVQYWGGPVINTVTVRAELPQPLLDYKPGERIRPKKIFRFDWDRMDWSYASFYPNEDCCEHSTLTEQVSISVLRSESRYTVQIFPSYKGILCIPGTLTNGHHVYATTDEIGFNVCDGFIGSNYDNIFAKTDDGKISWEVNKYGIVDTFDVIGDAVLWRDMIVYFTNTVLNARYYSYCGARPSLRELKMQDKLERALQMAYLPPKKPSSVTTADFIRLQIALQLRYAVVLDDIVNDKPNIEIVAEIQTGIERASAMLVQLFDTVVERTDKVISHLVTRATSKPTEVASLKSIYTQLTAKKTQITGQGYDIVNGPLMANHFEQLLKVLKDLWEQMDELEQQELALIESDVWERSASLSTDVSTLNSYEVRCICNFAVLWALSDKAIKNTDVVEIVKQDLLDMRIGEVVLVKSNDDDSHLEVAQVGFQDLHCTKTLRLAFLRNGKYTYTEVKMDNPTCTLYRFEKKDGPPTKKPRNG